MLDFAVAYLDDSGNLIGGCYVEADSAFSAVSEAFNKFYPSNAARMEVVDDSAVPGVLLLDIDIKGTI